jgi:hypothetical protein
VRRRTLLGGVALALTPALGGCFTGSNGGATPTARPSGGTPDFDDPLEKTIVGTEGYPATYPDYRETARVVGYDGADTGETDVVLEPSTRTVTTGETLGFRLTNPFAGELVMNDYDWQLHKWVDGRWYYVTPWVTPSQLTPLPSGQTQHWTVTPTQEATESGTPVPSPEITTDVAARGFGGGVYAFGVDGLEIHPEQHGGSTTVATTFELDASPLELTRSDNIEETMMEGETLVARSARDTSGDEDGPRTAYLLQRIETPPTDPQSRITEQVVRNHQLRDAIALARDRGVSRVRIEGYGENYPDEYRHHGTEYYEYEGVTYEATAERLDS